MKTRIFISVLVLSALIFSACANWSSPSKTQLRIIAPDYMKPIFDRATAQFYRENKILVVISYVRPEAIVTYAKGNDKGDILFLSNPRKMEALKKDTLFDFETATCPFRISMVLTGRIGGPKLADIADITQDDIKRIVIVDPDYSYEGSLAKKILLKHRLWDRIQSKLILAQSSSHLLTFVATGEADAAIAFEYTFNRFSQAIIYKRFNSYLEYRLDFCGVILSASKHKRVAQAFLDFFDSPQNNIYTIKGIHRLP